MDVKLIIPGLHATAGSLI